MSARDYRPPIPTPLGALHASLGARIVEFAGYALPLSYPDGIVQEHLWTRQAASLFDVSHMGQIRIAGARAAAALESLMPLDLIGLPPGRQRYGLLTNDDGGIIDDLMVANLGDSFLLIVNAACKDGDLQYFEEQIGSLVEVERLDDRALLAVQGPAAEAALGTLAPEIAGLDFMGVFGASLCDAPCFISRSGYAGEDGFEISVPAEQAETLARALLAAGDVRPAGLGARDTLRLEAGLCLYGQDIDATTSPVEAGLAFTIARARRPGSARPGGFPGHEIIIRQLDSGVARRRVGLDVEPPVPVRAGTRLQSEAGAAVGSVTSGGFGPTIGAPVAMAYVDVPADEPGTSLAAIVRGRTVPVTVRDSVAAVAPRYRRLPAG